jgi:hypothetical protein
MNDKESSTNDSLEKQPPYKVTFESFVASMATQALIQLGEMPAPPGIKIPKDLSSAKNTIDILNMLKEKTSGNLDSKEQRMLDELIHNLRLNFVNKSK